MGGALSIWPFLWKYACLYATKAVFDKARSMKMEIGGSDERADDEILSA